MKEVDKCPLTAREKFEIRIKTLESMDEGRRSQLEFESFIEYLNSDLFKQLNEYLIRQERQS